MALIVTGVVIFITSLLLAPRYSMLAIIAGLLTGAGIGMMIRVLL